MEAQVEKLQNELGYARDRVQVLKNDLHQAGVKATAYDWLRKQELMLMTTDGVKYLKGDDLDAYVKEQTTATLDLNEAVLSDALQKFNDALRKSMGASKVMWSSQDAIDSFSYNTQGRISFHGSDTREES